MPRWLSNPEPRMLLGGEWIVYGPWELSKPDSPNAIAQKNQPIETAESDDFHRKSS